MKLKVILLVLIFLVMVGCSNSSNKLDTFSKSDLTVIKIDDKKTRLYYGMKRDDVEKLLGKGNAGGLKASVNYDYGVSILYRDDIIASIKLDEESKGIYQTSRGAMIGMTKEEIKSLYGDKYPIDVAESNLDYIYDSKEDRFIGKVGVENKQTPEEMQSTYLLSVSFDIEGHARSIFLLDRRMAMLFN